MGPLAGTTVIEVGGIGPAPFCGMLFADMGADVVLIERKRSDRSSLELPVVDGGGDWGVDRGRHRGNPGDLGKHAIVHRGKQSLAIDLKKPAAAAVFLRLVRTADVLIEGFRPGVMEKLGLGPDECLAVNPRLVYGRISGWGQSGPLSQSAGHDINYIALAGALYHGGPRSVPPAAPPTLIGDVGGGAMVLATGILAAVLAARQTGEGQVIDAAISDGAALMTSLLYSLQQQGAWVDQRQSNLLDGGSPWYDCYECADGGYVSIGALEPKFYRELLQRCGLDDDPRFEQQFEQEQWPAQKKRMAELFKSRKRSEWCDTLEGTDACFAPVLTLSEAPEHPHNVARQTFVTVGEVTQPAPAPRFSRTPAEISGQPPVNGEHTIAILDRAGLSEKEIADLRARDVI